MGHPGRALALLLILHGLVYPSSNGYNAFFDRDKGPVGGLEHPPEANILTLQLANALDVLALMLLYATDPTGAIAFLGLGYILVSRAYSYDGIRLKADPILSTVAVLLFQGPVVYWMARQAADTHGLAGTWTNVDIGSMAAGLFLAASYPLTQIYQHEEDAERGDMTLSRLLGMWGTLAWTALAYTGFLSLLAWMLLSKGHVVMFSMIMMGFLPALVSFIMMTYRVAFEGLKPGYREVRQLSLWGGAGGCVGLGAALLIRL